jgi:hypothetical protein
MALRRTLRLVRAFALRAPMRLQQACTAWRSARAALAADGIALDGQTIRRSLDRAAGTGAMQGVHAWASPHEVGLAQFNVEDTSNEITAPP